MFDLFGNINKLRNIHSDSEKKKIAKLLQTTPEALEEFESISPWRIRGTGQ